MAWSPRKKEILHRLALWHETKGIGHYCAAHLTWRSLGRRWALFQHTYQGKDMRDGWPQQLPTRGGFGVSWRFDFINKILLHPESEVSKQIFQHRNWYFLEGNVALDRPAHRIYGFNSIGRIQLFTFLHLTQLFQCFQIQLYSLQSEGYAFYLPSSQHVIVAHLGRMGGAPSPYYNARPFYHLMPGTELCLPFKRRAICLL